MANTTADPATVSDSEILFPQIELEHCFNERKADGRSEMAEEKVLPIKIIRTDHPHGHMSANGCRLLTRNKNSNSHKTDRYRLQFSNCPKQVHSKKGAEVSNYKLGPDPWYPAKITLRSVDVKLDLL